MSLEAFNAMACPREGFTVQVQRSGSAAPAGVGFVVDGRHILTCAHVVNAALGREQRAQDKPGPRVRVQVDFPMLGGQAGAPSRSCAVEAWVPPPVSGVSGGDVAGLVVVGDMLPEGAGPALLAESAPVRDVVSRVFGFPGDPPRQVNGAWSELRLRGLVGGGVIQLDTGSESAIRAQPGYSGSPVIATGEAGDDIVVGMLAVASGDSDARDAYAIPVSELARAWPHVVGRLTIPACPYRGLGAFTADDADLFVGREDEVSRLHEMVRTQAFVVVTGPSGVGKSSLVNAGLIPLVRAQGWAAGSFRPGGLPLDALARALAAVQAPSGPPTVQEIARWAALIRSEGLTSAGAQLALSLGRPVLLHANQLEEVLDPAACPPGLAAEFLEMLLSAQVVHGEGFHLVGTLRADFWTQLLEHPDAGPRLGDRCFGLSPMSTDRLEKVIAEPAQAAGVHYQDGLVRVIAGDAGGGRGLPLLEFALTQLWPHQQARLITLAGYQGIGGVTGALNRHAERTYQELLGQFSDERIRRVMLALVRSRGGAAEATRRLVSRLRLGEDWEVARSLAKQRLLIVGDDDGKGEGTAEIAHEALIREWPRFAGWVNEDSEFQHWLASAEERIAESELLPDTRLAEADRWLAERGGDVPSEVRQLVQDSKSESQRRLAELENARKRAEEAARYAEARRLAAAAELALTMRHTSLQIPIALAIEALRIAPAVEADIAIRHAIQRAASQVMRKDHHGEMLTVAVSPDGTRIAVAGHDHSALVLDMATGAEISRLNHGSWVWAVAFSPDGTRVATASGWGHYGEKSIARLFDAATGAEIWHADHDDTVNAVAFSPDGTRVATASGDSDVDVDAPGGKVSVSCRGGARVFDAATGAEIAHLKHDRSEVHALAFSPDGTQVVTGSGDQSGRGSAQVFGAATGLEISRADHEGEVVAVAFSPDGTKTASGCISRRGRGDNAVGGARVFDSATGAEISRLDLEHDRPVNAVVFSPDGSRVAAATGRDHSWGERYGSARVFDTVTGAEISRLDHDDKVNAVAFSPDGTLVATASSDHTGRVLDAATGVEICRLDHDDKVNAVAFSPDGTLVVTASSDHTGRVFTAAASAEVARLDHDGRVQWLVFSPDGTLVATASRDHTARVLDVASGAEIARMDHDDAVSWVAFSPDGTKVATGSEDHSARVFEVATGAQIARMKHDAGVRVVAFSPDGTKIATTSRDATARVFDAVSGAEICRIMHYPRRDDNYTDVYAVAFSADGSRLATGSGDSSGDDVGFAALYNATTGKYINGNSYGSLVTSIAFSPDGTRVAVGSADWQNNGAGSAHVLDAKTWAEISRLENIGEVNAVAFSPDGTSVAIGCHAQTLRGRGGSARVFDAATGIETSHLDHDNQVWAIAFSPDGALVATGSNDYSARVFDAVTGAEIARADHQGEVHAVAFSPDGGKVATGSWDGSARIWYADHNHLIEQAAGRLTRNLTLEEWKRFFRDEPYRKTRADLP